jgi:ribosomal 50S subunit-recycling heat shock protein
MRLDLFLKVTRLLKQRTVAKQACDAGAVRLNGELAKPGSLVHPGDRLRLDMPAFVLEADVLDVPSKPNVPRKDIERYVRILEHVPRDPHTYVFGDDGDDTGSGEASRGPETPS